MTYHQKLRDPRWQKLRLEVMQRDAARLVAAAREEIAREPLAKPDYAEGRDPETLAPLSGRVDAVTILVAAKVGPARLIDNITLSA